MIRTIKIGFLSLYSSIYPNLNHEVVEGFALALGDEVQGEKLFEFVPEYVQQGGEKAVSEAIKKLIHFHGVDLVAGPISYVVAPQVVPFIESRGKLAFFFDLGECIPSEKLLTPRAFYNSYQLWQAEYALGHWAHKTFGDKGTVLMPTYEAGYQMHAAFRQGAVRAGSQVMDYTVLPHQPAGPPVSRYLDQVLENLKASPPAYLHALFSGTEATEFLAKFCASGLGDKVPLLVSPLMARQEWLDPVSHLVGSFYSASVWNPSGTHRANERLARGYAAYAGKPPGVHVLLGYEMGLAFREMLPELRRRDWAAVTRLLQTETFNGPRGPVNFWPQSGFALPTIDIEKITLNRSGNRRLVVGQGQGLLYNSPAFDEIHRETASGWQNPYLAV
jgi:branched-chain amino acid transport system substrate-binding protein